MAIFKDHLVHLYQLRPDEYNRYEAKLHELQQSLTGERDELFVEC